MRRIRDLMIKEMPVQIRELNREQGSLEEKRYDSCLVGIRPDGSLELKMPQGEHGLILITLGARCEVFFASEGCEYFFVGEVKERYRRENRNILAVEPKTFLKKACMRRHAVL